MIFHIHFKKKSNVVLQVEDYRNSMKFLKIICTFILL